MSRHDPVRTSKVSVHRELHEHLVHIKDAQAKTAAALANIAEIKRGVYSEMQGGTVDSIKSLQSLYRSALTNTEQELDLLSAANAVLSNAIALRESRTVEKRTSSMINSLDSDLPFWPDTCPGSVGSLVGATRLDEGLKITAGHQVAANLPAGGGHEHKWILGIVVKIEKDKYIVEDIVAEASSKERYSLPASKVIPLPHWIPPPGIPGTFFAPQEEVLAMYPQTSCFYRAVVHEPPTADRPLSYKLHFYDDDYEDGSVQYQVVCVKYVLESTPRRH